MSRALHGPAHIAPSHTLSFARLRFGVEKDRMDKSAVGHEYEGKTDKHASQRDYAAGFGGKYGVQKDRIDKVRRP